MRTILVPLSGRGFALLDVLVAAALVATVAGGAAQIVEIAIRASDHARARTVGTLAAAGKLEQLRSLAWTHVTTADPAISMSFSDVTTDLSRDPATDDGPGLLPSPPDTLESDVVPYVEYLDHHGYWLGRGPAVPASTVYIRRWSVRPLAADPDNTLVLRVVVTARTGGTVARLTTLQARR